jgi:serine/threonine protein kinase/formylglycine-generating enzyme required for sulfatase activity
MAESSTNGKGQDEDAEARPPTSRRSTSTHESAPGDGGADEGPAEDDLDVLKRGATVGRYLVLERLGAGAMGVVYAAYDPELDRKVAIKLLRPSEGRGDPAKRQARLVREAKAMAKLSHANVGAIFDVGVHEGQVFLAIEYLPGGTLRSWLEAEKRPWREIVRMFIEVGNGLAAAHAEGLIHRDFKPDNVLLDKAGKPKVVDFGLVRLTAAIDVSMTGSLDDADLPIAETAIPASAPIGAAALTRTGALAGTPAYMAPEQFLGKPIDERTDQFAFCIALYEALYGERPFSGDTVIAIADSVTEGRIRAASKNSEVPNWVRTCLLRGLQVRPAERYPGFEQLLSGLSNDPIARRKRLFVGVSASTAVLAGLVAIWQFVLQKRHEIDKQVAEHLAAADLDVARASGTRAEAQRLATGALVAFDTFARDEAEALWQRSLANRKTSDEAYKSGIRNLEAAVSLAPSSALRARTADAIVGYLTAPTRTAAEREASLRQLVPYDDGGRRAARLKVASVVRVTTTPPGVAVSVQSYDPTTFRLTGVTRPLGRTPLTLDLPAGSYRLSLAASSTHVGFYYPVLIREGQNVEISLEVPLRSEVPAGFVYVPPGRFLFGSSNEEIRSTFLDTVPIHEVHTDSFLIARYETTTREWIDFLEALSPDERKLRTPRGSADASGGFVSLRREPIEHGAETWTYMIRPTNRLYKAHEGDPFVYHGRTTRQSQDWTRFPVTGISAEDAEAYCSWLNRSGRVPRARLCTEYEWERAARGADGRDFPHGSSLSTDDANFDLTYGRVNEAYGPDEVGAHPLSESPFGLSDMVGNVWEMTRSVLDRGQLVIRGGSFYQFRPAQQTSNRNPVARATRDQTIGLRVCASKTTLAEGRR